MTEGVVKSLGVGRFLDWKALEALEQLEKCGKWGSLGVHGVFMVLSPKRIRSVFGINLGQSEEFGENPGV
ncbi:hypothetical protein CK203_053882 [Vitis vinifera]|uniref:Uncharacterized protein n=1 Tax=Vitis vinifera TaxID=29760 RepID=A0A438GSD6_VITVI|nr:hypothetical protein CK203_053882 [Vitis vinifera]